MPKVSFTAMKDGTREDYEILAKLEKPFLVLATQNPIENEGTYKLPEAQVDRFALKILIKYPTKEEEIKIIEKNKFVPGLDVAMKISKSLNTPINKLFYFV